MSEQIGRNEKWISSLGINVLDFRIDRLTSSGLDAKMGYRHHLFPIHSHIHPVGLRGMASDYATEPNPTTLTVTKISDIPKNVLEQAVNKGADKKTIGDKNNLTICLTFEGTDAGRKGYFGATLILSHQDGKKLYEAIISDPTNFFTLVKDLYGGIILQRTGEDMSINPGKHVVIIPNTASPNQKVNTVDFPSTYNPN
jgi:hypothetical protein